MVNVAEPMPKVIFGVKVRVLGWNQLKYEDGRDYISSCMKCKGTIHKGEIIAESAGSFGRRYHIECAKKMAAEDFEDAINAAVDKAQKRLKALNTSKI